MVPVAADSRRSFEPPQTLCIPDGRVSAFRTQWSETNCCHYDHTTTMDPATTRRARRTTTTRASAAEFAPRQRTFVAFRDASNVTLLRLRTMVFPVLSIFCYPMQRNMQILSRKEGLAPLLLLLWRYREYIVAELSMGKKFASALRYKGQGAARYLLITIEKPRRNRGVHGVK